MADVERIASDSQVRALAKDLNSGLRIRPAVVVSIPSGFRSPWIDVHRIANELGSLADVFLLSDPAASWTFSSVMPDRTSVYGGAGRVYPPDLDWVQDPFRSRLQLSYSEEEGERATTALIDAALDSAAVHGLLAPARSRDASREVTGVVSGCPTSSQAVVDIGAGWVSIRVGTLVPGVDADRVFRRGMRVSGRFDTVSRVLDVRGSLPDPQERVSELQEGQLVWARIDAVTDTEAQLCPYPGISVAVTAYEVIGASGDLRDLLTQGETVATRVRLRPPGLTLMLVDADSVSAEPITALSVLPEGPPWLLPPAPPPPEKPARPPAVPPGPARRRFPTPADLFAPGRRRDEGSQAHQLGQELDAARESIGKLDDELKVTGTDLAHARHQIEILEKDLATERDSVTALERDLGRLRRKLRDLSRSSRADDFLFLDPEEQFRYYVHERWVQRIPAAEKPERPLRDYRLGPGFLTSLEALDGISRGKVHDVAVEVLTGLADLMSGRDIHRLRTGLGGDNPVVRRDDGAVCWRVALQRNAPSARRLHFWRHSDYLELSRVVVHDDWTP